MATPPAERTSSQVWKVHRLQSRSARRAHSRLATESDDTRHDPTERPQLHNANLTSLMLRSARCCSNDSNIILAAFAILDASRRQGFRGLQWRSPQQQQKVPVATALLPRHVQILRLRLNDVLLRHPVFPQSLFVVLLQQLHLPQLRSVLLPFGKVPSESLLHGIAEVPVNLDRQRMVVKLPQIRLHLLVALQEYLHEAAGGDRRLHLFQCRDDLGGIAACTSEEVFDEATDEHSWLLESAVALGDVSFVQARASLQYTVTTTRESRWQGSFGNSTQVQSLSRAW